MIEQMLKQAETFEKSGQLDLAQKIYNVALELLPENEKITKAQILILRGRINHKLKNPNGAIRDLQHAIELDSTLTEKLSGEFTKFYKEQCH